MRLLALLFLISFSATAEKPEHILPKTKVIQSKDWYAHQSQLWRDEVSATPLNAKAWINYYASAKYANAEAQILDMIALKMHEHIGSSAEYFFVAAWNSGFSSEAHEYLKKSIAINGQLEEAFPLMLLMKEFLLDQQGRREFSEKTFHSHAISTALLQYSYNVLMSASPGAILFTDSDNTTIPLYILQDVYNIRTDVEVLNLDLLSVQRYRDVKLKQLQLVAEALVTDEQGVKPALCTALPLQNKQKSFYYALTLNKEHTNALKDNLYVVGLASQLSHERIDNIARLKENLEQRFLLDYLTVDFNGENAQSTGKIFSANYLMPLLILWQHYTDNNVLEKSAQLETLIRKIATENHKTSLVENLLSRNKATSLPIVKIDVKALEGMFKPVWKNVYAFEYEITNQQYNQYLEYLATHNLNDQYALAKHQLSQYDEPALTFMKTYHTNRIPTKKEKYFNQYPVVNISYEAALQYCEWLTTMYNNNAERKYKKVKVRLPSVDEWQVAAVGIKTPVSWKLSENKAEVKEYEDGKEFSKHYTAKTVSLGDADILYPWFKVYNYRNRVLNHKGCSLGNFKFPDTQLPCRPEKMITADGFTMMSSVGAYFPNDIGLYDVVGNVAEMVDEKGKACGGSWNHTPEESTIKSITSYDVPNAHTGFRIFMEVIEP